MHRLMTCLSLLVVCCTPFLYSQPSCYPEYGATFHSELMPSVFPPLNSGMTYETLVASIVLDSVCKSVDRTSFDSLVASRTSWDDTLKLFFKHSLHFVNDNPILSKLYDANDDYHLRPKEIRNSLYKLINSYSPSPNIDKSLVWSDYILVCTVNTVSHYTDSSATIAASVCETRAVVDDTILGKVLPNCQVVLSSSPQLTNPPQYTQCIVIDTRRENIADMLSNAGQPSDSASIDAELALSGTYLVFLRLVPICHTDSVVYYFATPNPLVGDHHGLYKVSTGGTINDPSNYFGLGVNPQLSSLVSAIEARKSIILGFQP